MLFPPAKTKTKSSYARHFDPFICNDVKLFDKRMSLNIRKSKTDQYRQGHEVLIGETIACPVTMLKKYLDIAHIDLSSDHFCLKLFSDQKTNSG